MKYPLFLFTLILFSVAACSSVLQVNNYGNDRAEIIDLMSRYSHALDFRDPEAFASTFAPDGVLNWARGEIVGRKALYDWLASSEYNMANDAEEAKWPAATRHYITNQAVRVDGDTAKAVSYWFQATNTTGDRAKTVWGLFGHYEDELVKIDGKWYFKYRTIYNEGLEGRTKAGEDNPSW
jgi:hypothetical protein